MIDKLTGLYHFLTDTTPKNLPAASPRFRKANSFMYQTQVLVARTIARSELKYDTGKTISLLGNSTRLIRPGDSVLIKPNFNSPDPFPASTDLSFLRAVIEVLMELGAKITVGESSGGVWRPTRKVFEKLGVDKLARKINFKLVSFDEDTREWVKVKINGDYLKTVTIPRIIYEADKIIYLPCMKTHRLGIFSGALKLTVGLIHPGERRSLHISQLIPKIAEINLACQPDLIIMDGRKAFVSGGPDKGQIVEPGIILASDNPVAIDVEAMKTILQFRANNKIPSDPWQLPQIAQALKLGLGPPDKNYALVTED